MEIVRVLQRKDGVKMVIIPKPSQIKKGDYVVVTNNLKMISKFQKEEQNDRKRN